MFTLPAVDCYAGSRCKPLADSASHYSSRQTCGPQIGIESDFKILTDEAEVDVEVLLRSRRLSSAEKLLGKEKQSRRELLLLLLLLHLSQERDPTNKKENAFFQHIRISTLKAEGCTVRLSAVLS